MKAEGAAGLINEVLEAPPVFRATVGGLRAALSELPSDMAIVVMVQNSDTGPCGLVGVDCKLGTNELVIIGERRPVYAVTD